MSSAESGAVERPCQREGIGSHLQKWVVESEASDPTEANPEEAGGRARARPRRTKPLAGRARKRRASPSEGLNAEAWEGGDAIKQRRLNHLGHARLFRGVKGDEGTNWKSVITNMQCGR